MEGRADALDLDAAMIASTVNIGLMNQHLRRISESVRATPAGEIVQVILILDNAGRHRSPKVVWPKNITPHFLPPYSPELEPGRTAVAKSATQRTVQQHPAVGRTAPRSWRRGLEPHDPGGHQEHLPRPMAGTRE